MGSCKIKSNTFQANVKPTKINDVVDNSFGFIVKTEPWLHKYDNDVCYGKINVVNKCVHKDVSLPCFTLILLPAPDGTTFTNMN